MAKSKPTQTVDPQYQYLKELHTAYQQQRTEADKVALELGGRYEKMLSLVAGGALAVSVTFIEKIAPTPVEGSRWLALIAWLLLGGAVVATLVAISASHRAQQKKIENLDWEILQKLHPADPKYQGVDVTTNPFARKVQVANQFSIWSAIIGLVCLILFVFLNFPSPKKQDPQNSTSATSSALPERRADEKQLKVDKNSGSPAPTAISSQEKIPPLNNHEQQNATPATPAASTPNQEITMPSQPIPAPSPPSGKPLTESYVPTPSPVAPPPPPESLPKGGK